MNLRQLAIWIEIMNKNYSPNPKQLQIYDIVADIYLIDIVFTKNNNPLL